MTLNGDLLRRVARVLLFNAEDRILLLDTDTAYTRAWLAPGGALEGDESYEEGALRELHEETGLRGIKLGPCVWKVRFRFAFEGRVYHQRERYFVARVSSHEVSTDFRTESESMEIREAHWWGIDEIARSPLSFRPANAADLLPDIIAGRYPSDPIIAPVEHAARTL